MNISTILDQIDLGSVALPEFQRGYVWNRDQVRGLMDSLYRKHPVGSLLVWVTQTDQAIDYARGNSKLAAGVVKLLLDGQQRITSLYGIVRGKPPKFFDGNSQAFTGLYFNLEEESFEFYAPMKMQGNPLWISVTDLMQQGIGSFFQTLVTRPDFQPNLTTYINRLNAIDSIKTTNLHIEEVTGEDKTVDVVVDIFNKVNSGGTKLSKGDLALAKICAEYPSARDQLKAKLEKWSQAGFYFNLDWLLRCITTTATGTAFFSALKDVDTQTFRKTLDQTEQAIDTLLNLIAGRLGLDHDRVLGSRYAFPLLCRYLAQQNGQLGNHKERDQLLYWYIHTLLWGRYAGSTESVLNQDLAAISQSDGALEQLIAQLRRDRGDLRIQPNDFAGWSVGSRFYPMLYLLTRVCNAQEWESGIPLSAHLLGALTSLQIHHIFPKSLLYKFGYDRSEVNAIANFTFLTQDTNLKVSNRKPEDYFSHYEEKYPGCIASHWIPMDQNLWKIENYRDFLAARRERLAKAANDFLDGLSSGTVPESQPTPPILERQAVTLPGGITSEVEEQLAACNQWVVRQGLPAGEVMYELVDSVTKSPISIFDLAWAHGLQPGLSQPVAILLDESQSVEEAANQAGYRFFTTIEDFKTYVSKEILSQAIPQSVP